MNVFKRKTTGGEDAAPEAAPTAKTAKHIAKLGNELQADIEALGRDFVKLVATCAELGPEYDDLKVQTLSRFRLHGLLQLELARADVQPHHGITDSTLYGRPTLGALVEEAAAAITQREAGQ